MSLGKIKKKIARDIKKSPAKAGALGLLALVAVYFWVPLLFGKKDGAKKQTNEQQATAQASTTVVAVDPAKISRLDWRELAKLLQDDSSSELDLLTSSPFGLPTPAENPDNETSSNSVQEPDEQPEPQHPAPQIASPEVQQPAAEPPPQRVSPTDWGLVLSGTIVGQQRSVALINGRAFAVGRAIVVADEVQFVLEEVGPRRAVLSRNGAQFELTVSRTSTAGTSGTMEINRVVSRP